MLKIKTKAKSRFLFLLFQPLLTYCFLENNRYICLHHIARTNMNVTNKRGKVATALLLIREKSKIMKNYSNDFHVEMIYYDESVQYVTIEFKSDVEKYLVSDAYVTRLQDAVSAIFRRTSYSKFVYDGFISELNKVNF